MKTSQSHFHDIHGVRYHVRTWGKPGARPVFMLHGWMDVSASFQFIVDCLREDWYVIAPDWRGFGLSGRAVTSYWFPDYYVDLDILLDLYSPDTPADVVGHSMGGNIIMTYAGLKPARIARLASLEGMGLAPTKPADAVKRYRRWITDARNPPRLRPYPSAMAVAERLRKENPRLTPERAEFLSHHWASANAAGEYELNGDPRHKMANPYLYRDDEMHACWKEITAPVLLIEGADSHVEKRNHEHPESTALRRAAVRDLRAVLLQDCSHMMHHDHPEKLAVLIEDFMKTPLEKAD
jgi:pimeloyl-ACP methyl ester carboxylesterase